MNTNKFDNGYYILDIDCDDKYPMLTWGEMDDTPFLADSRQIDRFFVFKSLTMQKV
ncbi:hypothetical protein FACS189430_07300 [Bacteroidia bacterium]|nr:hypothetical protein FACS189430_07300 [Bacteroidia bacterium]